MTPKEKYEYIINLIEKYIELEDIDDAAKIVQQVEKNTFISNRELNTIFKFLMDKSILEYVKSRQMNKAYDVIVKQEQFDCSKAIEMTGYCDQPTFIKAFKKVFNTTPYEAYYGYKRGKIDIRLPLISWDFLNDASEHRKDTEIQIEEFKNDGCFDNITEDLYIDKSRKLDKIYNLDKKEYDLIKKIEAYKSIYNFNQEQSDCAYHLIKEYDCDIIETFNLLEEYDEAMFFEEDPIEYDLIFLKWAYDLKKTCSYDMEDLTNFNYFLYQTNIDIREVGEFEYKIYRKSKEDFLMHMQEQHEIFIAVMQLRKEGYDISCSQLYNIVDSKNIPVEEAVIVFKERCEYEDYQYYYEETTESYKDYIADIYEDEKSYKNEIEQYNTNYFDEDEEYE